MSAGNRPKLILASASPRRRRMLEGLRVEFALRPVEVDETPTDGEEPRELVRRLARSKALAAVSNSGGRGEEVILAADTIVVIDGEILGKPADPVEAEAMLARLAGQRHKVYSGVAVLAPEESEPAVGIESTQVEVTALDAETIHRYVATGEPLDKAGAYAIQGLGAAFIARITGSYSNVVGLPLTLTRQMVAAYGVEIPALPVLRPASSHD